MLQIRIANHNDYIRVRDFYYSLIDAMKDAEYNEGYKNIQWSVDVADAELLVIHVLCVHPTFSGKGIAKQMVQKVLETAIRNDIKTIRLDVFNGNLPAEKAYTKMGFKYIDTIQMYYEDTGWTDFKVFEYIL